MIPPDLSSAPAAAPARPVAPVEAVAAVEGQGFAAVLAETVEKATEEGAEEGEPASQATPAEPAPQVAPQVVPPVAPPPILAVGLPQAAPAPAEDEGGEGAPETKAVEAAGGKAAPAVPAAAVAAPPPPAESGLEAGGQLDGRTGAEAAEGEALAVSSARPAARVAGEAPAPRAILADPSAAAAQAAPAWRLVASHGAEAAHAPKPARAREVAEQITLAVATAAEPQVELRLDPPELGRVQIRLTHGEAGLQAVVLADRPETQDFLRRNAEALRIELTEAGYGSVSLEFSAGQDAAPRDRGEETRRAYGGGAEAAPLASAPRAAALPGGLDIRL